MDASLKRPATSRSYAGLPPEQRVARRRQQFIEAGRQLFGTIGYRKTTVRLLCKEAGLTDRYFYESFASIEALLVAVYEGLIDELESAILTAFLSDPEAGLEARIRSGVDALFRVAENPQLSRVIWIEILGVSPGAEAVYNVTLRRFADLLFSLGNAVLQPVTVPEPVLRTACMGLIGAASETAKDWLHASYQQPREVLVDGVMVLFRGLIRALRTG